MRVDINCDLGEGFGPYRLAQEEQILPYVTSANLACGFHGGDPVIMRQAVQLCRAHGVAVGAHPGHADRYGFGRRPLPITPNEVYAETLYQVGALAAIAQGEGVPLHHVKPHGALYHQLAQEAELAEAFCEAIAPFGVWLYAPPRSQLAAVARRRGLKVAVEAFADRGYTSAGQLLARGEPGALLTDPAAVVQQALAVVAWADTLCLHGDTPGAASLAAALREGLAEAKVEVQAL